MICSFSHFASLFALAAVLPAQSLQPERVLPLKGPTNHVQGVDFDGDRLWVTSVDTAARKGYLREFSLAGGALVRSVEVQDGVRFHPGGISAETNSVWLPVAEYRRNSTSVIQRRGKRTLELEFQFPVPDHIGCLAVTPEFLIGGNWDSRKFYIWNHRGELQGEVANPTGNAYQDIKFESGLLVASGLLADRSGAIDWLEWPAARITRRLAMGNTNTGAAYTREGMAIHAGRLLLLPEDGPASRVFFFSLK